MNYHLSTLCVLVAFVSLSGCEAWQKYNATVGARQVGVGGQYDAATQQGKGEVTYRVEYNR